MDRHTYRGKRLDNGEWVWGDLMRHYENQRRFIALGQMAYTYTECGIDRLVSERFFEVDPATIGQCTGLKDKHGKAIFEGDVVEWDGQSMDTYKIIYGDDASFFGVPINGRLEQVAGESLSLLNADLGIVVVGTIHDAKGE